MNRVLILGPARSGKSTAGRAIAAYNGMSHGETSSILKEIYYEGAWAPAVLSDEERSDLLDLKKRLANQHGERYLIEQLSCDVVDGIRTLSEFEAVFEDFEYIVWVLRKGCPDHTLEFTLEDAFFVTDRIQVIVNDCPNMEAWAIKAATHAWVSHD